MLRTLDRRSLLFKVQLLDQHAGPQTQKLHFNKTPRWFIFAVKLGNFKHTVPTLGIYKAYQRKTARAQPVQTEQLCTFLKGADPQMEEALWARGLASGGVLCKQTSRQSHPRACTQGRGAACGTHPCNGLTCATGSVGQCVPETLVLSPPLFLFLSLSVFQERWKLPPRPGIDCMLFWED